MFDIYNSFVQAEHTQGATNLFFIQFILAVFLAGQQSANPLDDTIDFETQVRPLLVQHCTKCHGAPLQKSGLRLDAKHAAFQGSDIGPVIVPGNADASELFRRMTTDVADERMPSEGQPLNANEIKLLQRWIDGGANWPETDYDREAARDPRLDHWAWQPVQHVLPPTLSAESETKVSNDIDRFILAELTGKQLVQSHEADRRTLIRRLSFDLHGLPAVPEEVDAFVNDSAPMAVERLVDRLLALPHCGERWARHWLDIAHYADWVVSPQNPLTARVIVNRLWHHHFGVGIVDTPSDFGLGGSRPSHPELLDWLAGQVQANGWSLKSVHRLICLSATYRQTSNNRSALQRRLAQTTDADNRYLWRQNSRRLDAESLRDAVLTVSGKRSPTRNVTTTALQSLALLNNEFILKQADYFAARLAENPDSGPTEQVSLAFRSAFGRQPSTAESTASIALIKSAGLAGFCRALLNANEFVYVD